MAWANVRNRWAVTQRLERREKPRGQARLRPCLVYPGALPRPHPHSNPVILASLEHRVDPTHPPPAQAAFAFLETHLPENERQEAIAACALARSELERLVRA